MSCVAFAAASQYKSSLPLCISFFFFFYQVIFHRATFDQRSNSLGLEAEHQQALAIGSRQMGDSFQKHMKFALLADTRRVPWLREQTGTQRSKSKILMVKGTVYAKHRMYLLLRRYLLILSFLYLKPCIASYGKSMQQRTSCLNRLFLYKRCLGQDKRTYLEKLGLTDVGSVWWTAQQSVAPLFRLSLRFHLLDAISIWLHFAYNASCASSHKKNPPANTIPDMR